MATPLLFRLRIRRSTASSRRRFSTVMRVSNRSKPMAVICCMRFVPLLADACQHAMACRVPGSLIGVNGERYYIPSLAGRGGLEYLLSLLQHLYTLCAL